jgi:putative ABC transport system permease protein
MVILDLVGQSLHELTKQRLRSFLTIFGITWGIGSFIFSQAVLDGFQQEQRQRFAALGKDLVVVRGGRTSIAGSGLMAGREIQLDLYDVEALARQSQHVTFICPELIHSSLEIGSQYQHISARVHGVWPVYQGLRSFEASAGRLINLADQEQARRICLLGSDVAEQLFGERAAILSEIKIEGIPYRVVGVARRKPVGAVLDGNDDEKIILPLSSVIRDFPVHPTDRRAINSLLIQPVAATFHEVLIREVKTLLARRHQFSVEDPDALNVFDTVEMAQNIDHVFSGLKSFGNLTAIITVCIGSIGIMNIMLISVRERTREIGIRRAVGARKRHIFWQFFNECLILTLLGGILGVFVGDALAALLGCLPIPNFAAPVLRLWPLFWACVIISCTGITAALYPTWQAIKITPVEALRYE